MQWDGQPDSAIDIKDASFTFSNPRKSSRTSSHPTTPYPISPSTTHNGDTYAFQGSGNIQPAPQTMLDLPTPGHSSNSSSSPSLPHSRLSGDTLWDRGSFDLTSSGTKRKFSEDTIAPTGGRNKAAQKPAPKKRPHNIIEKRYRANLNEKIAELRDSVPSLRIAKKSIDNKEGDDDDDEDLDGVTPSSKLNKASILTKATEYIKHLELRNRKLDDENKSLKQRLLKLERVIAQGSSSTTNRGEAFTSDTAVEQSTPAVASDNGSTTDDARNPPQGLIPVPDIWRKLRATASQSSEHYGHVYDTPEEGTRRGGWPTKLMVGSLAGLMIMEGFSESDQNSDSAKRGLFGIPLQFFDGWWFLRSPGDFISAFMVFCRAGGALPMVKGFMALSIVAFLMMSYLFNSKPKSEGKPQATREPERAPSLASPIEVRRAAWSTSTQVLRIPHHSFFPEWLALTLEWLKYSVRFVLGYHMYYWLTGRTGEDELARVKAWDIAIDAQLAGGDTEISRSRAILTIFASGLLPLNPSRLMLKALHCRLVLYGAARKGSALDRFWNRIGAWCAEHQWSLAQQLHGKLPIGHPDRLPRYAAALLARDCRDVMMESVLQRAYNLLYDRPTSEATDPEDSLMDVVVEDHAVRSPLDALSAWFSCHQLREALIASLEHSPEKVSHEFDYLLHSAIAIAPEGSAVHMRAIAVKAVFFDGMRAANMQTVLNALPSSRSVDEVDANATRAELPVFIDSSTPLSACGGIEIALQCANTMATLQGATQNDDDMTQQAIAMFAHMPINPVEMSLLNFAPVYYVLRQLTDGLGSSDVDEITTYNRLIRVLYHWSKIEGPDSAVITADVAAKIRRLYEIQEKSGFSLSRRQSSLSHDTGYVSSGETEEV